MTRYEFRKRVAAIVTLSLLALICPMPADAAGETVSISDAAVASGETVTLPIYVTGVTNLGSATIWLSYDKDVVTVDSVADGDMGTVIAAVFNDDGVTKMIWYDAEGVSGDRVFANVNLRAAATSAGLSSPLNLEVIECVDISFNPITPGVTDATFTVSGAAPTQPAIAFMPSRLSFSAIRGGDNPQGETLEIWNSGAGTLNWAVSDSANWLSLSPANGSSTGEKDDVTISVDVTGMSAGDYSATITIAAAGATNTPRTLAVSLTLTETAAPIIAFSPASFSFSAVAGEASPANKTLEIWNSGTGTLDWSVSDNADWLSLSPTGGSSTGEHDVVTASVNIAGMGAGNYSATITIAAPGATNTPRTVPVSLTLTETAAPTIAFGPASLSFSAVAGAANPANQTLEIWNSGTGILDWSASADAAWLTLAPTSGSSTGEHDEVTASVNIAGMSAGDYSATISIAAAGATNTPRTLAVSLTLTETEGPISPIDKLRVMAPWIAVGVAIVVGIILLVRRRRSAMI